MVETIAELVASGEYAPGDFAIMYRTNAQSARWKRASAGRICPTASSARRRSSSAKRSGRIAYLRLVHNPDDNVNTAYHQRATRGIGMKTLETLDTWADERHDRAAGTHV